MFFGKGFWFLTDFNLLSKSMMSVDFIIWTVINFVVFDFFEIFHPFLINFLSILFNFFIWLMFIVLFWHYELYFVYILSCDSKRSWTAFDFNPLPLIFVKFKKQIFKKWLLKNLSIYHFLNNHNFEISLNNRQYNIFVNFKKFVKYFKINLKFRSKSLDRIFNIF